MHGSNINWNGISDFCLFSDHKKQLNYEHVNISDAINMYKEESYLNKSTIVWEYGRSKIIEFNIVKEWKNIFYQAQNYTKVAFDSSTCAQQLVSTLNINSDLFIKDLPCVGAAMERLLYKEWGSKFFNHALDIYNSGYWICGYKNNSYIICGEIVK